MKKRLAVLLGISFMLSALSGCTNRTADDVAGITADNTTAESQTPDNGTAGGDTAGGNSGTENVPADEGTEADGTAGSTPTEGALKTGLALVTSVESSADASADAEGIAQADAMIAAVTVDADGKIAECVIDCAQTVVTFGADGKITADLTADFPTKNELGRDYGMNQASSIGKDWNEQAAAFAAYCVGKTADEVKGIAVAEGKAADADLAAGCTLYIGGFQEVVAQAVANAVPMSAQPGDKLGLGVTTNIAKSKDATADENGLAEAYTTVTAVTVNADGYITSAVIDAVQADVNFDASGKITSDISAAVDSRNTLGDSYGMKAASSIGKEWNEQAAAYAQYAVGKTVDEVNGTAVTEGVPSDADLAASVTIHITDFNTIITKAVNSAKQAESIK